MVSDSLLVNKPLSVNLPLSASSHLLDRGHQRSEHLFFAADDAGQDDAAVSGFLREGGFDDTLRALSDKEQLRRLIDDIGQHQKEHIHAGVRQHRLHIRQHLLFDAREVAAAHAGDLRDRELDPFRLERLAVDVEDLVGRFVAELGARVEHRPRVLFDIDARDRSQLPRHVLIDRRTGRGAEHQGIGEDRRAQEPRDRRLDVDAVFFIHHGDDGRGTAQRLVAEIDRAVGLHRVDTVVVDDLEHLGGADAVHRLTLLVMVDQNHLLAVDVQQVALGDHADVVTVGIENGEIADAQLGNGRLDVDDGVLHREGDDILGTHQVTDRNALVDQLGGGIGIERRDDDGAAGFPGDLHNGLGDLRAETDDQAARSQFDGAELAFAAVGEDDHIARGDMLLHQIGIRRRYDDLSLGEFCLGIADDDLALQSIGDIAVRRFRLGQSGSVLILHVKARLITQREHALDLSALGEDGNGLDILVAHMLPRAFQRERRVDALDAAERHVGDRRLQRFEQERRRDAELFQYIFGLAVELARAAGDVLLSGHAVL